jgi:tetratricopeptide (TPR) repeat protein
MRRKLALIFIGLLGTFSVCLGQTVLLDSLNLQLRSDLEDTTRFNILEAYIKAARVDFSDSAIFKGNEALQLAQKLNDKKRQARALTLLGTAHYYNVEYVVAEKMHRQSVSICRREKINSELANALGSLALTLQTQQKFQEAFETYYEALKMEETNNNGQGVVKTLTNLAILYRNLGDYDNALKNATTAYKLLSLPQSDWPRKEMMKASITNTIGLSHLDMQQYDSALFYLAETFRLNRKTNNITYTANAASNIAYCYIKQNKVDSASVYIDKAYALYSKISNEGIKSAILINYGAVQFMQNHLTEALKFTEQGVALAKKVDSKNWILYGYRTQAEILQKIGKYKQAYEFSNRAYQLNDSLQIMEAQRKAANIQRDYEIQKKQQSIDVLAQQAKLNEEKLQSEVRVKFYLIASIVLLVITGGATYYALRQKLNTNKKLQVKNEEIARKNEVLESVNRNLQDHALRIQMKPHFIFNALNSIQFLILQKQNEKAFDYLSKFSQLLRSALEFSDQAFIELDKELKWLELYVQLESLRFNNEFEFTLDNQLSAERQSKLKLPPLLVQPFLENAIAHGLMTKPANRNLKLSFLVDTDQLVITVSDNGIGREAAALLNAQSKKHHRSFGMDLVSKRLEILRSITGKNFTCHTTDGQSENGKSEGTVVKIKIPI